VHVQGSGAIRSSPPRRPALRSCAGSGELSLLRWCSRRRRVVDDVRLPQHLAHFDRHIRKPHEGQAVALRGAPSVTPRAQQGPAFDYRFIEERVAQPGSLQMPQPLGVPPRNSLHAV